MHHRDPQNHRQHMHRRYHTSRSPPLHRLLLPSRRSCVNELRIGMNDPLDRPLFLEMRDGAAGEGAVDLHPVDEGGRGDDAVGRDFLHDLVTNHDKISVDGQWKSGW